MPVLINFKICDNSKDCSGIDVCPTGAFYWDNKNKTIAVDESRCIACGKCEEACPVHAIRVAKTEKEYKRIKGEVDGDPRKVSDLFVDRYGAEPIHPAFFIPRGKFKVQVLEATQIAVVECFNKDSIRCLLYSIPIKELFKGINVKYRKIKVKESDLLLKKYKITKLPALLFFKNGVLKGKIEGYHSSSKKEVLARKINEIMGKAA